MKRFEYKHINGASLNEINNLAVKGWRVIEINSVNFGSHFEYSAVLEREFEVEEEIDEDEEDLKDSLINQIKKVTIPDTEPPMNNQKTLCPKCNIDLSKATAYCCPELDCPAQSKVTC